MIAENTKPKDPDAAVCGLYVHIPFCQTKCGYCDFYSVPLGDRVTRPLVDAVKRELHLRTAGLDCPIATVFVGGGTPTLLPPDELVDLLKTIGDITKGQSIREWTVEANPATVDEDKAAILRDAGVTRVSMGAQSFIPAELATLERLHNSDDIPTSVEVLRRCGIESVNLDLIFGVPGQTLDTWRFSLERAIVLNPDHVSCYALTYEPGTRLTAQRRASRVVPCDEDLEADLYDLTVDTLAAAGFAQYEISNYARPGRRCLHNLLYWRNQPYVGVGPSAAGCLGRRRHKNVADVSAYVRLMNRQGHAEAECETLDDDMMLMEMVMMQLRLVEGLSRPMVRGRLGFDPVERFGRTLERYRDLGMVTVNSHAVALSPRGRFMADAIIADLVAAPRTGSPRSGELRNLPRSGELPGARQLPVLSP